MKKLSLYKVLALFFSLMLISCNETEEDELFDAVSIGQTKDCQIVDNSFVSLDSAVVIANKIVSLQSNKNLNTKSSLPIIDNTYSAEVITNDSIPAFYIINYSKGGFAIISATKDYYPVLAYSNSNNFDTTIEMKGVLSWLDETKNVIMQSKSLADSIKIKMHSLWNYYAVQNESLISSQKLSRTRASYSDAQIACWNRCDELQMKYGGEGWQFLPLQQTEQVFTDAGFPTIYADLCFGADFNNSPIEASVVGWKDGSKTEQVGPLLSTKWHQRSPFNDLCNGNPAGCAAVALSQIMKYYEYPQSFSLNGYPFNWTTIPNDASVSSNQAALVRLVGNMINMNYSSSGSWATPSSVEDGISFMGYQVERNDFSFERTEREVFNYKRPVLMLGSDDNIPLPSPLNYIGNSHYWVCEGVIRRTTNRLLYFTEWQPNGNGVFVSGWNTKDNPGLLGGVGYLYFYMNWGWGGTNDGWFAFNNVNSGNGDYEHSRQDYYIIKP